MGRKLPILCRQGLCKVQVGSNFVAALVYVYVYVLWLNRLWTQGTLGPHGPRTRPLRGINKFKLHADKRVMGRKLPLLCRAGISRLAQSINKFKLHVGKGAWGGSFRHSVGRDSAKFKWASLGGHV